MNMQTPPLKNIIEAALMAADGPMTVNQLATLFDEKERPQAKLVRDVLKELQTECNPRGVELKEVASGFRYQAKQDYSPWLKKLWEERPPRYSRALMETLVLIAYRQPITRAEIEEIRGVAVSSQIIKTLAEREWIKVVGHRDAPGKPALLGSTKEFLDYFNLKDLNELPTLAEIRDLDSRGDELEKQLQLQAEEAAVGLVEAEVLEETVLQQAEAIVEDVEHDAEEKSVVEEVFVDEKVE